jgi:glycosyltransferase involved in cell wall biosynthesis
MLIGTGIRSAKETILKPGATERYLAYLFRGLIAHDVSVALFDSEYRKYFNYIPAVGIDLSSALSEVLMGLKSIGVTRFVKEHKKNKQAIIHAVSPLTSSIVFSMLRSVSNNLRFVYTCHDSTWITEAFARRHLLRHLIELSTFKKSHKIIAVQYSQALKLRELVPNARSKITVIHNGVDTQMFNPNQKNLSKQLQWMRGFNVILYVGPLMPEKGAHILIKSYAKLLKDLPSCRSETRLVIVGPLSIHYGAKGTSSYVGKLLSLCKKLGIVNEVIFTGELPPFILPPIYSNSYMFVAPYLFGETLSLAMMEALASELPVITTDRGDGASIINKGRCGFLIKENNVEDLAAKMALLLDDKKLRNNLAMNGRVIAENLFSWDSVVKKTIKVYESLL